MPRIIASSETETTKLPGREKLSCGPGRERKESSRCHCKRKRKAQTMLPTWEWGSPSHRETWEKRGRRQ